jgi:hypothetical protein
VEQLDWNARLEQVAGKQKGEHFEQPVVVVNID